MDDEYLGLIASAVYVDKPQFVGWVTLDPDKTDFDKAFKDHPHDERHGRSHVVMSDETEWPRLVELGVVDGIGMTYDQVFEAVQQCIRRKAVCLFIHGTLTEVGVAKLAKEIRGANKAGWQFVQFTGPGKGLLLGLLEQE